MHLFVLVSCIIDIFCFNKANVLFGREMSGRSTRNLTVSPNRYINLQLQRRTLGHLSAVYCLLFDHSGRYIVTVRLF